MPLSYRATRGNLLPRSRGLKQEVTINTDKMGKALSKLLGRFEMSFTRMVSFWKASGLTVSKAIIKKTPKESGDAKKSWKTPTTKESTDRFEVHIASSGVDYIVYLEFGSSKKAPKGMVRVSMAEFVRALPKFADQLVRFII